MEVADRIVVMNEGRVEQIGSPAEIYDEPASPFVMRFVGEVNVLPDSQNGDVSQLFVRPHDLELLEEPLDSTFPAVLQRVVHMGKDLHAELQLEDGRRISAQLPRDRLSLAKSQLERGLRLHIRPRVVRSFS